MRITTFAVLAVLAFGAGIGVAEIQQRYGDQIHGYIAASLDGEK